MHRAAPADNGSRNDALLRALQDPSCYPHPAGHIELIETHISWVLLAGEFAYKIKKPLNLGFLDYSTLARRRRFCAEELRVNRRLAPGIYLGVAAIVGPVEAPRVAAGNARNALEYAVRMRRFDPAEQFDRLLEAGRLLPQDIDALARHLARFHAEAPAAKANMPYGTPEAIIGPVLQNFLQIVPLLWSAEAEARERLLALEAWTVARHAALAPAMRERRTAGRVREGHGDLHLGNLVRVAGEALAFDAIEFDPALRWGDVFSDLAFLVMDLCYRGRRDLAFRFLDRYLAISGDYGGMALLDYYRVYRALVRAKVLRLRAAQGGGPLPRAESDAYLAWAQAVTKSRGIFLLATHGVSGSGKTTLTTHLLEHFGALRLRSDVERKRLHGLPPQARSGAAPAAGIYSAAASAATYGELARLADLILAAGYPVLVDAACLRRADRECLRAVAAGRGVPFLVAACEAPEEELRRRVVAREARGGDASEADLAVLEHQLAGRELPAEDEPVLPFASHRETPEAFAAALAARLGAGA